jgi:hypothetical protein
VRGAGAPPGGPEDGGERCQKSARMTALPFCSRGESKTIVALRLLLAGRKWPQRRKALHLWAVLWNIVSIFICYEVSITPAL